MKYTQSRRQEEPSHVLPSVNSPIWFFIDESPFIDSPARFAIVAYRVSLFGVTGRMIGGDVAEQCRIGGWLDEGYELDRGRQSGAPRRALRRADQTGGPTLDLSKRRLQSTLTRAIGFVSHNIFR
jgi:hypothetical protein